MAVKSSSSNRGRKSEAAKAREEAAKAKEKEMLEHKQFMTELMIWVLLIVSIIIFLCVFNLCGPLSNVIGSLIFGLFGFVAYIFPLVLFFSFCFYYMNKNNKRVVRRVVGSWALYFITSGLFDLFTPDLPKNIFKCYVSGYKNKSGGGLVGACISNGLSSIVGELATGILLVIFAIMLFAFITGKLIASFIVELSSRKYNEYLDDFREERKRRREEMDSEQDEADIIIDEVITPKPKKKISYTFPKKKTPANDETNDSDIVSITSTENVSDNSENIIPDSRDDVIAEHNDLSAGASVNGSYSHNVSANDTSSQKNDEVSVTNNDDNLPVYEKEINDKFGQVNTPTDNSLEHLVARALERDRVTYNEYTPYVESDSVIETDNTPNGDSDISDTYNNSEPVVSTENLPGNNATDNSSFVSDITNYVMDTPAGISYSDDISSFASSTSTNDISSSNVGTISTNDMVSSNNDIVSSNDNSEMPEEEYQDILSEEALNELFMFDEDAGYESNIFEPDTQSDTALMPYTETASTDSALTEPAFTEATLTESAVPESNSTVSNQSQTKTTNSTNNSPQENVVDIILPPEPIPYTFPSINLLNRPESGSKKMSRQELNDTAKKLQDCLKSFKVEVTMTDIICGPTVTRYELQPSLGTRVKKITELENDIKLNLAAADIRIEAPIPGKSAVGIEVPNPNNVMISLREMLETPEFTSHKSNVAFAVGKDIGGNNIVADIAKMPHMLIAGSTGSGKSVCINTIVMSILYKADPNDVKLIMIDPKVVELSVYNGIPHLCIPVVTDPKKAAAALNWAVAEMNERYAKFAELGVRDMIGFNKKIESMKENPNMYVKMPQIIIIVDELADLMMVASHDVETAICRLAQMARAAGLHLIIATQRPSVDVITGLIKANVPSRIAFAVSSAVDSRTIIDGAGAEKLLGKGDMLFFPQGLPKPVRIQGAFVSDSEVARVTDFVKGQYSEPVYDSNITEKIANADTQSNMQSMSASAEDDNPNGWDEKFEEAGKFIIEKQKASIGTLQRVFKIGFNRGARIMDQLCEAGVVSEEDGKKPRNVLMTMEEFEALIRNGK